MGTTRKNKRAVRDIAALMRREQDQPQPDLVLMVGVGRAQEVSVMRECWPDAALLGIEAHPMLAERACKHLPTINAAVVMPQDLDEVVFYGRRGNPQASSLWERLEGRNDKMTVPATSLDRILHGPCSREVSSCRHFDGVEYDYGIKESDRILLWADAEGSELGAMRGGPELMKQVDWIHIELTPRGYGREGWPDSKRVHRWLYDQGFERRLIHDDGRETEPHNATYVRIT